MTMVLVTQPNPNIPTTNSSVPQTTNPSVPSGTSPSVPEQIDPRTWWTILQLEIQNAQNLISGVKKAGEVGQGIATGVEQGGQALSSVGDFLGWLKGHLTDLQWWKSIGLLYVGLLLVAGGSIIFAFGGVSNTTQVAAKAAAV